MKVAILGYGSQGKSAYEHWNTGKNVVTICDSRVNIDYPKNTKLKLGRDYLTGLDDFNLIVRGAPIIHPRDIEAANPDSPKILEKVWSNTNEFFKICPSKNIIGVTGTKGKGTTSSLITAILEQSGQTVHLGGNIGIPPLELLKNKIKKEDWVVLELANFQLIDIQFSPQTAVCLMIEPEHLDWHKDYDEYIAAKQKLFAKQTTDDYAIYYANNKDSKKTASAGKAQLIPYMKAPGAFVEDGLIKIDGNTICKTSELKLLGEHNWQNVCAAISATWHIAQDISKIKKAVTSFKGLPFRIEPRGTVKGVSFYNDSFASAADASLAAMKSIPEPKLVIVGGFDRNLDLSHFAQEVKNIKKLKKLLIIGQSGPRLIQELEAAGFSDYIDLTTIKNMPEIVAYAAKQATKGDAVVLSPGFASFDMFDNFEDRGNKFNDAVKNL